jgi:hypothetical protein
VTARASIRVGFSAKLTSFSSRECYFRSSLKMRRIATSVSTGKPFGHSRESGNANYISREFPGSRELIFD